MIAINAKYIHTSLAVRSIKTYCDKLETKIDTREFTINNDEDSIINEVYDLKPDLLGISCYIWNIELVLNVVSSVKKILPNIKIFLGGPEVSYNYNYLFEKNIDVVCIGEGEQTVQQLVELFNQEKEINDKFGNIKGIAFKLDDKIINTEARDLLDLNDIPFVYSDINMSDDTHRILYYEASRGCPYNCQYCLSSLEKGLRFLDDERVCSDLQFFLDNNVKQVKFVDRTFNCNKRYAMLIWGYLIKNDNGV
ncbi:MAG: radical SAM protein, partial [bacterium]